MKNIKLFTIGFTKKTARQFFESLKNSGVANLVDIRVHPNSHLASFTRAAHLSYFCEQLGISYIVRPELAPPEDLMRLYREGKVSYADYKEAYILTLTQREVFQKYKPNDFNACALLCCEAEPDGCHRKILAEYIKENSSDVEIKIIHL